LSTETQKVISLPNASLEKKVSLSQLINKLNHSNFQDEPVLVNLRHRTYGHALTLYAAPQPCVDELLECRWLEQENDDQRFKNYDLVSMVMTDGRRSVQIEPNVVNIDARQVTCRLPDEAQESAVRAIRRYRGRNIKVQLTSSGATFSGELIDYNGFFFRVGLRAEPPSSFDWISRTVPVNVTLLRDGEPVYIGDCKLVRHGEGYDECDFVLQPTREMVQRFKAKEFRPERRELIPNPSLVFKHPLTGKTVTLKVSDLSGTGFGVVEQLTEAVLLPGMILPEVGIHFTSRIRLMCKAQVIHRKSEGDFVYSGLGILDIDIQDHLDLVGILYQAKDPDTMVANCLDLDALWDFFFETGFIYPIKYQRVSKNKELFKATYQKLYEGNPTISRHFIHMDHGQIQGHFAILRLYEKTWISHHHAALPNSNKAGLIVMGRMTEFINEVYSLRASNFLYSAGYYRSDNKFPVRFFGGFAKKMNNPKICSIDPYAFINFEVNPVDPDWQADGRWEIAKTTVADLEELNGFYNQTSGGGMSLAATDMLPSSLQTGTLSAEYEKLGFRREIHRMSVRKNGVLKAVTAVNITDLGLNLSELSNAVHIYIVDGSGFTRQDLRLMMSLLAVKFNLKRYPAMVYPGEFLDKVGESADRTYTLITVNLKHTDEYMRYTTDFLKRAKLNGF
jgi:hypothetical protein